MQTQAEYIPVIDDDGCQGVSRGMIADIMSELKENEANESNDGGWF